MGDICFGLIYGDSLLILSPSLLPLDRHINNSLGGSCTWLHIFLTSSNSLLIYLSLQIVSDSGVFQRPESLRYIIFPSLAIVVVMIMLIVFTVALSVARKKRSMHGKYNPQKQEVHGLRFELNELKMRPPPEERLI